LLLKQAGGRGQEGVPKMMFFGLFFTIAVVVGIVLLVAWAARGFKGGSGGGWNSPASQTPREVLQARYARGEITRDQYQQAWRIFAEAGP
jgi:putative membrane protein